MHRALLKQHKTLLEPRLIAGFEDASGCVTHDEIEKAIGLIGEQSRIGLGT